MKCAGSREVVVSWAKWDEVLAMKLEFSPKVNDKIVPLKCGGVKRCVLGVATVALKPAIGKVILRDCFTSTLNFITHHVFLCLQILRFIDKVGLRSRNGTASGNGYFSF